MIIITFHLNLEDVGVRIVRQLSFIAETRECVVLLMQTQQHNPALIAKQLHWIGPDIALPCKNE